MSLLVNDQLEAEAVAIILARLTISRRKHPLYPTDPVRRVAIIVEEVGEAMQAALDVTRGPDHAHHDLINAQKRLFDEVVDTAATAVNLLVHMINERDATKREKVLPWA